MNELQLIAAILGGLFVLSCAGFVYLAWIASSLASIAARLTTIADALGRISRRR